MTLFSTFAQQHLANKLGVSIEDAAQLYMTVLKMFSITIANNKFTDIDKSETFSAYLTYNDGASATNLMLFKSKNEQTKFATPEEAFEVAIQQVNSIEFTGIRNFPPNVLLLFDTQFARTRFEELRRKK